MAQRPWQQKATIKRNIRLALGPWLDGHGGKKQQSKKDRRLPLAQWLNCFGGKKQQPKEVNRRKGWPWHLPAP
jgi:hypothetical protein